MNKEFYAPAKFKMALPGDVPDVDGGIIFPSGLMADALVRRKLGKKHAHMARRLIDPQLYLAELPAGSCRKACTNLATYPWFSSGNNGTYESGSQTQAEWRKDLKADIHNQWAGSVPAGARKIEATVSSCVTFQRELKCEAIILPSPLVTDIATNYSRELAWLDAGLKQAATLAPGLPAYATIAVSDTALRVSDPYENDLLSIIIDQVTARAPKGAYIVIEQANENGYYCTHPNTVGALLRLVHELKAGGVERIVLAPFGTAGLLGLAAGADAWCVGWYRGERRIKLADFTDQMGMAVPTYYSHQAATEFHLANDLDRVVVAGLLEEVADETDASRDLLRALRGGAKVASVPEWQYRQSNVGAACEHFLRVAVRETAAFGPLSEAADVKHVNAWLRDAERLATKLYRIGNFNARTELGHQANWIRALQAYAANS